MLVVLVYFYRAIISAVRMLPVLYCDMCIVIIVCVSVANYK